MAMLSVARRKGDRSPGRQLTVASIAGRVAAAALYCTDLHCLLWLGVVPSGRGGGEQGADASYYPAEAESVCFLSLIHSYGNAIGH